MNLVTNVLVVVAGHMGVGNISGDPGMLQDLMPCLRKETGAQIYDDAAAARRKAIDPCRCEIHLSFKKCSLEPAATMKLSLMAMPKDTDDVPAPASLMLSTKDEVLWNDADKYYNDYRLDKGRLSKALWARALANRKQPSPTLHWADR